MKASSCNAMVRTREEDYPNAILVGLGDHGPNQDQRVVGPTMKAIGGIVAGVDQSRGWFRCISFPWKSGPCI